jgi:DNA-binding winged helix-turn-helix (wHTH) protein
MGRVDRLPAAPAQRDGQLGDGALAQLLGGERRVQPRGAPASRGRAIRSVGLVGGQEPTLLAVVVREAGVSSTPVPPLDDIQRGDPGADDYIRTPIEPRELAARINARLRYRSSRSPASPVRLIFPGLVVDVARREVLRDGTRVALTPTELDLVVLLAGSPGQVISRAELIERVWGRRDLAARSVDAHVYRLRRKLEPEGSAPIFIQAVQGVGYRFERRGLAERLARAQGVSSPALVTALADAR